MRPVRLKKLVFFLYVLLPKVMARPSGIHKDNDYNKNVEDYLIQFGYLPKSSQFAPSMRTHQQFENAVKNLQYFAGLNATGRIDDFTLDLMAKYVH